MSDFYTNKNFVSFIARYNKGTIAFPQLKMIRKGLWALYLLNGSYLIFKITSFIYVASNQTSYVKLVVS